MIRQYKSEALAAAPEATLRLREDANQAVFSRYRTLKPDHHGIRT